MYDAILFDLDGTLLPMEMQEFVEGYFAILAHKAAARGYEREALYRAMWQGVGAMVQNDGSCANEVRFWALFRSIFGERVMDDRALFDEFYAQEFHEARRFTQPNDRARMAVERARAKAGRVILATNPIFPAVAVRARLSWVGLAPEDFDLVTSYENSSHCKPSAEYYRAILAQFGLAPERCLMVGNDIGEDILPARSLGMETFFVTDCAIRRELTQTGPEGGFSALLDFLL